MLVNGELVDDALVRLESGRVKEYLREQSPDIDPLNLELQAREVARERVIEQTILRQEAQKDPSPIPREAIEGELQRHDARNPQQAGCLLPRDREVLRAKIEADLRLARFAAVVTRHVPKPTSKQVSSAYHHAKQSLLRPETIRASHIVKNVDESTLEEEARAAIERAQTFLHEGMPFEQVADEHSDCPGLGGDLGFFARGQLVEEFDANVFDHPPGFVTPIFRTPFGFHIAKIHERRPAAVPPLAEVRAELEEAIWRQARQEALRVYLDEARSRAEIRKSK